MTMRVFAKKPLMSASSGEEEEDEGMGMEAMGNTKLSSMLAEGAGLSRIR